MIRQYGERDAVFVAGYVDKGETAEDAVIREVREELGMTARELHFHRSRWYAPSETLMLHYSVTVPEAEAAPNWEVDGWAWLPIDEVRSHVAPGGLAEQLLDDYLNTL
jgi:NAD+ diphosphatase